MDSQSLTNVLGLLRLIKSAEPNNMTARQFIIRYLSKSDNDIVTLHTAAYIIEQVDLAQVAISNSNLTDEGKAGVIQVLRNISENFRLDNINNSISKLAVSAPSSIANFVILLSAYGIPENPNTPREVIDLASEVENTIELFDDPQIDPSVREVGKQHLKILSAMLKNINIIGLEPALTEYFSLVTKIRRADIGSSDASHQKSKSIWERVETWSKRIGEIDKIWNAGAKLLESGDKISGLLDHIP